jgi:hypothetical protein
MMALAMLPPPIKAIVTDERTLLAGVMCRCQKKRGGEINLNHTKIKTATEFKAIVASQDPSQHLRKGKKTSQRERKA